MLEISDRLGNCFEGVLGEDSEIFAIKKRLLALGALHRIVSATACTVESMPWTAGCYNYCTYFGISVKTGWKYHFFGTVLITTFLALFFVVWSSIAWPC